MENTRSGGSEGMDEGAIQQEETRSVVAAAVRGGPGKSRLRPPGPDPRGSAVAERRQTPD